MQERESVVAPGLNAFDLEGWLGEIQDQTVVLSGGTQVRAHKCKVYICDGLYGLEFDDDVAQDEEVEPVKTNFDTSTEYRDRKLALERDGTMSEFD
jgi:hypothetical protein